MLKFVFLVLGLMASYVGVSVSARMASDWDYYLTATYSLHPTFILAFVWLVAGMNLVASLVFFIGEYRERNYRPKNVRSTYLPPSKKR
jgi:hypothetical protein